MNSNDANVRPIRTDSIEDQDKFLLHNKNSIVQKLRLLAKNHCLITAYFNSGNESMNTAVVGIIRDMDLVALDYGVNEKTNQRLLAADRIIFKAKNDGITAQFSASSIVKAKYKNNSVFAIPIPEQMLWLQRREYFRVRVPLGIPAYIHIKNTEGAFQEYPILDISAGGLAILDEEYRLNEEIGTYLRHCTLNLPDEKPLQLELEIRNQFPHQISASKQANRIGCAFLHIDMSSLAQIQRYINNIQAMQKRTED